MDYDAYLITPAYNVVALRAAPGFYTTPFGTLFVPLSGIAKVLPSEVGALIATGNFTLAEETHGKGNESAQGAAPAKAKGADKESGESKDAENEAPAEGAAEVAAKGK